MREQQEQKNVKTTSEKTSPTGLVLAHPLRLPPYAHDHFWAQSGAFLRWGPLGLFFFVLRPKARTVHHHPTPTPNATSKVKIILRRL